MDPTLPELLLRFGPWLLLLMAWAETSFVTGLAVPAGLATAAAAMLAGLGHLELGDVVVFSAAGAVLGDTTGFWVGRRGGRRLERSGGMAGRLYRSHEPRLFRIFRYHPLVSVSGYRLVSFVRTLMPLYAGSRVLSYPRFLLYDLLGVAIWTAGYVAVGLLAGKSWERAAGWIGTGWAAVFAVVLGAGWLCGRLRRVRA